MSKCVKTGYELEGPVNIYGNFISENPETSINPNSQYPKIDNTVFVGPFSSIIGNVRIKENVFIGCNSVLRADEGTHFYIGPNSNIQDRVVLHGLKDSQCSVDGKKYSIYIGSRVSITHGVLIHGPAIIGNGTFVGFNSTVFNAIVENNCYINTGAIVTGGVRVGAFKQVPIGAIIDTQEKADGLLEVSKYQQEFAKEVVDVNLELALAYSQKFKK